MKPFVSTPAVIAGHHSDKIFGSDDDDRLDEYGLWRKINHQVKLLGEDMDNTMPPAKAASTDDAVICLASFYPHHSPTASDTRKNPETNAGRLCPSHFIKTNPILEVLAQHFSNHTPRFKHFTTPMP
jgi:hypothetical protein